MVIKLHVVEMLHIAFSLSLSLSLSPSLSLSFSQIFYQLSVLIVMKYARTHSVKSTKFSLVESQIGVGDPPRHAHLQRCPVSSNAPNPLKTREITKVVVGGARGVCREDGLVEAEVKEVVVTIAMVVGGAVEVGATKDGGGDMAGPTVILDLVHYINFVYCPLFCQHDWF